MPEIFRFPFRFDCLGVDLVNPVDRMPAGAFPYLLNVRVLVEGRLEARPGYTPINTGQLLFGIHSLRRLNDPLYSGFYTYVIGVASLLYIGTTTPVEIDTGYSTLPLCLIPFRPTNSPGSWMYVYDTNKLAKVKADGTIRPIGVAIPGAPAVEYAPPSTKTISTGTPVTGWTAYGEASSPAETDRTGGTAPTISQIVYAAGTTGWACISPSVSGDWAGARMQVELNHGGGNDEVVVVREIHPAINSATLSGILYDAGTVGYCTMIFGGNPPGLTRNSLIQVGSEVIRVLSVTSSLTDNGYSIRCFTNSNHAVGASVTGLLSWFVYTVNNHSTGESISAYAVEVTGAAAGTGSLALLTAINLALTTDGRTLSAADDYLHLSLFTSAPSTVTNVILSVDVDLGTTSVGASGNAFTQNYYQFTVAGSTLNQAPNSWTELLLPLSSATRIGSNSQVSFWHSVAFQIQVVSTAACNFGFSSWYFFGTYGPVIQPNSPTGYLYFSADRDSTTGAASVIGPAERSQMFPLREAVYVTPVTTTTPGIDSLDVYVQGGTITNPTYIGTTANYPSAPGVVIHSQADSTIAGDTVADTTLLQPWPILQPPWSGTASVVGTSVMWASGNKFNVNLLPGTVINIYGIDYQIYDVNSTTFLEIDNAVDLDYASPNVVPFTISNPVLTGQPLPFVFGPLEGPFAPVIFGLGDPNNPGTLYYTNASNADAASDQNTLELCSSSEPLISGAIFNGVVFVGSREHIFLVRYSYLTTLGVSANTTYQFNRIPSPSGIWMPWACVTGPDGVYFLGQDGIYVATEQGAQNISDAQLYGLFPHNGQQPTAPINGLYPVNMGTSFGTVKDPQKTLRLSATDEDIKFFYTDLNGSSMCLRYEINKKRWFPMQYASPMYVDYLDEQSAPSENIGSATNEQRILLLGQTNGYFSLAGGDTDNGTAINSAVQLPSLDEGDERAQKLFVDTMQDVDGTGTLDVQLFFNDQTVSGASIAFTLTGSRTQVLQNISSLSSLNLYRNISALFTWTGGPDGPRLYAFEPSGYLQPYLSSFLVTQFISLSAPGWKSHRRLYPGYISNSPILFTIKTQDGRTYGPFTLPSTSGQFKIIPQMLTHGIKDLAFAYQLDGQGQTFALFPGDFTIETKLWDQDKYALLPVFKG